jgi:hypothetical protein
LTMMRALIVPCAVSIFQPPPCRSARSNAHRSAAARPSPWPSAGKRHARRRRRCRCSSAPKAAVPALPSPEAGQRASAAEPFEDHRRFPELLPHLLQYGLSSGIGEVDRTRSDRTSCDEAGGGSARKARDALVSGWTSGPP